MYRIPSTLNSDLDYTESLIKKYQAGEIKAGELKSNRVPMGIYEQRENEHYMLRVRCAGGLITPKQLAEVAYVGRQVSHRTCISPHVKRYKFITSTCGTLFRHCANSKK